MTPTTAINQDDLHGQLTEARERTQEAEAALGAASLDGAGVQEATKALESARAEEERLELMLSEASRREADEAERAKADAERAGRADVYQSLGQYLPAVATYLRKRTELNQAEETLWATPVHRLVRGFQEHMITSLDPRLAPLDHPLVNATPALPLKGKEIKFPDGLTPERCEELAARAQELEEAERSGKDIGDTFAKHQATAAERRERRRRERRR